MYVGVCRRKIRFKFATKRFTSVGRHLSAYNVIAAHVDDDKKKRTESKLL